MILANFTLPNRFSRALPHPLCGSPLPEGAKDRLKPLPRLFDKPQFAPHLYLLFLIPNTLTAEETWVFHAAGSRRSPTPRLTNGYRL